MPALTALIGMSFVLVMWVGGRQVFFKPISLGEFVAFYAYMIQLIFPIVALGFVTNIFQRGAASMGRLNYILDAKPSINDSAVSAHTKEHEASMRGEIEFRHLDFTYPTGREAVSAKENGRPAGTPVLHDINLRVPAGSTLAIVGPTGSGKSTLAALVARLWEAPRGSLLIDGRPIQEWPLASLRRSIGFVPQDTYLFSEPLRENIAFGTEECADEAVYKAAETASMASEIAGFPMGYATLVGERGITLSGGQKQRTALARALVRSAGPYPRRCSLQRRHRYRGTHPRSTQGIDEAADHPADLSSRLHGPQCRSDYCPARWPHRGTRHTRRTPGPGRLLRRALPETIARRRARARMSDFREEEALGKVYDSHLARRLFRYLRPYRGWVAIAALLTLPVAPLAALGPKLFEMAVDRYFVPVLHDQIATAVAVRGLGWISLAYLATLALGFAFMYFQVRVMQKVGQDTMYDLRKEIFQHLQDRES